MDWGEPRLTRKSALMSTAHPVADSGDKLAGDPIDRTYLARFTMGNSAVEHEVLHLFADQVPRYLEQLRDASVDKAWQQAAHTIKGSASAIGAWRLARFAEMAEQVDIESDAALSEGHRDDAVAALATATDEVCRFIARLLANP
jgi:HPt (histidine-containing phosphotransfer) domain-containing protein